MTVKIKGFKKKMRSVTKYLRELSVVVAGIAITFLVSDLISDRNEKKEIERYLDAINLELEENLEIAEEHGKIYDKTAQFSHYLMATKPEKLSIDSLDKYDEVIKRLVVLNYKTSALEMFKMSGSMRLIKDKTLLSSILEAYRQIELSKVSSDVYMDRKTNEIFEQVLDEKNTSLTLDISLPESRRLLKFFSIYMDVDIMFRDCILQIKETLSLLEDYK